MIRHGRCFAFLSFLLMVGCAAPSKRHVQNSDNKNKVYSTQRKIANDETSRVSSLVDQARGDRDSRLEMIYPLPKPLNEDSLYSVVLQAAGAKRIEALEFYSRQMAKRFPASSYADNTFVILGDMYFGLKLVSESLRAYERVLRDYPTGNKVPAALLGKAKCFRHLGLLDFSERALLEINEKFPGSKEAVLSKQTLKTIAIEKDLMSPEKIKK
jgi:TolA-binding protein